MYFTSFFLLWCLLCVVCRSGEGKITERRRKKRCVYASASKTLDIVINSKISSAKFIKNVGRAGGGGGRRIVKVYVLLKFFKPKPEEFLLLRNRTKQRQKATNDCSARHSGYSVSLVHPSLLLMDNVGLLLIKTSEMIMTLRHTHKTC